MSNLEDEFAKELKEIRDKWHKALISGSGLGGSFIEGKRNLSEFDKDVIMLTLKGISIDVINLKEKYNI